MVSKLTNGVNIMVNVSYVKQFIQDNIAMYFFEYNILIENKSKSEIQLLTRFWHIKDALNYTTEVSGEGVVGEMPIVKPNEYYSYKSNCAIYGLLGSMSGYYTFVNTLTNEYFRVKIPMFKLQVPYIIN